MSMLLKKLCRPVCVAISVCLTAGFFWRRAWGSASDPGALVHALPQSGDPYALLFQVLAIVLITAAVGHFIAGKLKQSSVMGEIVMGIVVGTLLYQLGGPTITVIRHYEQVNEISITALQTTVCFIDAARQVLNRANLPEDEARKLEEVLLRRDAAQTFLTVNALHLFSSLGIILLLFLVGLECNLREMRAVGGWALGVAIIGMAGIFFLSYPVLKMFFLPGQDPHIPVFLAAAFTATSIGISARVFYDLNRLHIREAKVVLGAAVIDDVLGLMVLAVVTGLVSRGTIAFTTVAAILAKAAAFMAGLLLLGAMLVPRLVKVFATLTRSNVRIIFPFALLMLLAWLADQVGLATIIGAFAAGLIIKEDYFPQDSRGQTVGSIIAPIQAIFAPIFFVLIGLQVDITSFGDFRLILMSLVIVTIIVLSKLASALALKPGDNRLAVAAGMLPRGEVTLIFASLGKSYGLLNSNLFTVIVIVMLLTTLMTPPLLKWALERQGPLASEPEPGDAP